MKIYVDLLLLQYFIINFFLIGMTGQLLHIKSKVWRNAFASFISSVYSILAIIFPNYFWYSTLSKLLLSILIMTIVFYPHDFFSLIKGAVVLHVSTYFLGGVITSMINEVPNPYLVFAVSSIICMLLLFTSKKILKKTIYKEEFYCNIKIIINDKTILARAFLDSGNNLYDIVTGEVVVIVTENVIESYSEELVKILDGIMVEVPVEFQTKLRMISYRCIGNVEDVLYGIKADKVIIYYDGKEIENKNVIIAMGHNDFENFDALASINLIEGGSIIGNSFFIKNEGKKTLDKNINNYEYFRK